MAKTKAEMIAEQLKNKRVSQNAFDTGAKSISGIEEEPQSRSFTDSELSEYVVPNRTQGRRGAKTPRMNLAIAEDVYEYIRRESRREGLTYSQFVCAVMRQRKASDM